MAWHPQASRVNGAAGRGLARVALALASLLALTGPALAQTSELPFGRKHLLFALVYRTGTAADSRVDFVVLGHYDFLAGRAARLGYFFYDTRQNLRPTDTTVRHPRLTPDAVARPGPIQIPTYSTTGRSDGTWSLDDGVLRVHIGKVIHEWVPHDADAQCLVPRGPFVNAADGSHTINAWTYSDVRGYGYLTDHFTLPRKLGRDDLLPDYKGEYYTLLVQKGKAPQWAHKTTELHVRRYESAGGGDVLGFVTMSRWVATPTVVFSTLLLNYAPYSSLLAYHNGGHDFNHNGVFDEPGHTTQLFGVFDGSRVKAFVFAEYSYQDAGQPLLSVGRYFAPP